MTIIESHHDLSFSYVQELLVSSLIYLHHIPVVKNIIGNINTSDIFTSKLCSVQVQITYYIVAECYYIVLHLYIMVKYNSTILVCICDCNYNMIVRRIYMGAHKIQNCARYLRGLSYDITKIIE